MIVIAYKPSFVRIYKKCHTHEQEEIKEKIELLRDVQNHEKLKVHKLTGQLSGFYSFSVTHDKRIIFQHGASKQEIILIEYGDHSMYR
jgi:addiction module RelE/StbE family toxin